MKKILSPFLVVIVMVACIIPYDRLAFAESSQINEELERLKKQIAEEKNKAQNVQSQMNRIQQERKEAKNDIVSLMNQIEETSEKLEILNEQVESTTKQLIEASQKLEEAETRVASRNELLKARLRFMYTNGVVSYLDVLLSSTSFSDFLNRYDALKTIVGQDKEILDANKSDRNLIAESKEQIEEKLAQVKTLYEENEKLISSLLVKEKEKEVMILSLDQKEKELGGVSEEQEKKLIELASKEAALLRKKNTTASYKDGKLLWPLPKKYPITSNFGTRIDPITGKNGVAHNGMDIGAPSGTDILAAEAGTVIVAQYLNGYGNTVIIDHGNGLWTLYPHIRNNGIKVKKEDVVKRGQKIAEVGSTGRSTGPHLHFEVRLNELAVNPEQYL